MSHPRHWPDPDAVVYARPQPVGYPCQLTTQATGKSLPLHNHGAFIDAKGNGNTGVDAGHFHRVRGFKVLPDESDGHTHGLTMLPCGAGAPATTGRDGPIQNQLQGYFGDASAPVPYQPRMEGSGKIILGVIIAVGLIVGGYLLIREE